MHFVVLVVGDDSEAFVRLDRVKSELTAFSAVIFGSSRLIGVAIIVFGDLFPGSRSFSY